jgi:hypothetical protein
MAWLSAGCQTTAVNDASASASADDTVLALLRYGSELRTLEPPELEEEYRELVAQKDATAPAAVDVRLALLLSNPNTPAQNVDQAVRLLGDVIESPQAGRSASVELARLLYDLLNERTCVARDDVTLAEILLAERERGSLLAEQLGQVQAALQAERAHRETLQGQLEALRTLEQQITEDGSAQ